jgi:hypothetical protein
MTDEQRATVRVAAVVASLSLATDLGTGVPEERVLRREQECCPFFSFGVDAAATMIRVDVAVPHGAEECLDDFERVAKSALATRSEHD